MADTTAENTVVASELQGTIVSIEVELGCAVAAGTTLALVESMKLHHDVVAPIAGVVRSIAVAVGATVHPGDRLFGLEPGGDTSPTVAAAADGPKGLERQDLADVLARRALGGDDARPDAVERRRARGRRTARENVADLVDEGSFVEYGPLVVAAQAKRRTHDDLITRTPADGMIGGIGTVNGDRFSGRAASGLPFSGPEIDSSTWNRSNSDGGISLTGPRNRATAGVAE